LCNRQLVEWLRQNISLLLDPRQSRSSWCVNGLERRKVDSVTKRATVVGRRRLVEVNDDNLVALDRSLGAILKGVSAKESAGVPILSHGTRDRLGSVDTSIGLGSQNLT
jgi:hypothetical protein